MHLNVRSSIIYNSQDMEAIDRCIDKENVRYIYIYLYMYMCVYIYMYMYYVYIYVYICICIYKKNIIQPFKNKKSCHLQQDVQTLRALC